jgi:hypothetical protein
VTEYLNLNREVVNILPSLNDVPAIVEATKELNNLQQDASLESAINIAQQAYDSKVNTLLNTGDLPVDIEHYYSQVNSLIANDATYRSLLSQEEANTSALDVYQQAVADAVANCQAQASDTCDPDTDSTVQGAIQAGKPDTLASQSGSFYAEQDRFWFIFYHSSAYVTAENDARSALLSPLSAIQGDLNAAHSDLLSKVNSLPGISSIKKTSASALDQLCGSNAALNALPVGDPTPALCSRLSRMTQLAKVLASPPTGIQATNAIYLPLVKR